MLRHSSCLGSFAARVPVVVLMEVAVLAILSGPAAAQEGQHFFNPQSTIEAVEFPAGADWLNTSGPISLRDLRGKIVVVDFWTYCCINCMHIMPDLEKLEKKYADQIVVIGIHSAKFNEEKDTANVRRAVLRYGIKHPVINDGNHVLWTAYNANWWPTVGIIDPTGKVVAVMNGENNYDKLDRDISQLLTLHRQRKTLDERPLHFDLDKYRQRKESALYFPGKILADPAHKRIFIADSSHNRVVITDLDGKKLDIAGNGQEGADNGSFDQATFNDPQGLALHGSGNTLYVADRKNDLIRALDLKGRTVKSVAGTGHQGTDRRAAGPGLTIGINSPWDLCLVGEILYIAMAGNHQISWLNVRTGRFGPYAGFGEEEIKDGTRAQARFAQPSGLATDGTWLYVADAEVSAVRAVSLRGDVVKTLIGEGLFKFGDQDGGRESARLQHCLGVACYHGKVLVADTYNNKIKSIDPVARSARTWLGDGRPAADDRPARFSEPGGLCVAGDLLYVADTNNHAVRIVDLRSADVRTLKLTGVEPPAPPKVDPRREFRGAKVVGLREVAIPKDSAVTLTVKFTLPEDFKLNPMAPVRYLIEVSGSPSAEWTGRVEQPTDPIEIKVPADKLSGARRLQLSLTYYFCREGKGGVCRVKSQTWEVPVRIDAAEKKGVIELTADASDKK